VIDHHIKDTSAQIHDAGQFFLCLFIAVVKFKKADSLFWLIQNVASGCGDNGIAFRAKQGNVLDHYLPAYAGCFSKGFA